MNKITKSVAVVLLIAPASAALANSSTGCGWGQMIWKGQSGLLANVSAATTNGILGNQTFGMTSGTGGCEVTTVVQNDVERRTFVANNLDSLAQDIAQGGGEHLSVLAALMGVSKSDEAAFFSTAQSNYGALFASSETNGTVMLSQLDQAMLANPQLSKYIK